MKRTTKTNETMTQFNRDIIAQPDRLTYFVRVDRWKPSRWEYMPTEYYGPFRSRRQAQKFRYAQGPLAVALKPYGRDFRPKESRVVNMTPGTYLSIEAMIQADEDLLSYARG